MSDRFRNHAVIVLTFTFFLVIMMNVALILNVTRSQADKIGNTQLDVIRSDLESTITEAETSVLRVSMEADALMDANASMDTLTRFFEDRHDSFLSHGDFMNIYIGGKDWHIVPGFDAPPDFHASERVWYLGAVEHPGEVYITEPYKDADTGAMCFSVSTVLSDGETVVGMDLNFSKAQESIEQMTSKTDQTAMIVTSGGLIAGYTDMSLVGERAEEKLPDYATVLKRVTSSKEHDSFRVALDVRDCVIFSSETVNGWYLILSVDSHTLYAESIRQMAMLVSVNLLMLVIVVVCYLLSNRSRIRSARVLSDTERFFQQLADKLRQSSARLIRLGDANLMEESDNPEVLAGQVLSCGEHISELAENIRSYSTLLREQWEQEERQRSRPRVRTTSVPSRQVRNGIILTLLCSLFIVLFFCVRLSVSWGNARMDRAADSYENHLAEWVTRQKSILYMFTDTISSQPELMDDYDTAVHYLNSVAKNYSDISACYMANPFAEHPVIMNTGWIPGEDERPETRPWYRDTERSSTGFNVSTPYLDAQTGNYCITLSRVVYGEQGEFLGIFGIDFFLDQLICVLGESYTSQSYAFLVDSKGTIINHPNEAYQMSEDVHRSIEDTEYAEVYNSDGVRILRDYSGSLVSCPSRETTSGFTVLVANRWWNIFGSVVFIVATFLVLFGFCIAIIVLLINRLIRWQEEVNRQLVEAAEDAVSAGKAKSQFLAQMSHEIRTPMNAIIGLDNIALRNPDLSSRTRTELEKIGSSARHLLSLINDILDMSRIESGRMVLKESEFTLRELLDQVTIIINGQCQDKGLRFQCSTAAEADQVFIGDDLKLKQVLINVLGNSVKFTDPPGTVSFAVEQSTEPDGTALLRFTMKDTGVGMDREFLPKLFEAFSQDDATCTNRYGGSGLGMTITKNIVEMMGGDIQVESEKGVGSTFVVSVPLTLGSGSAVEDSSVAPDDEPEAEPTLAGWHVLIAEDNELNAEILTDLLDMEEISCEWARNGQEAVELFAQSASGHFQAVLMDMRMPVMDGLTASRELRKLDHPDAKRIPIIALTANAFEEDVQLCLQAGMNYHLSKPVDIDLLVETMKRLGKDS